MEDAAASSKNTGSKNTGSKTTRTLETGGSLTLGLLEETPVVTLTREPAGSVILRKIVETRQEMLSVELRTETLVITRTALEAGGHGQDGGEPGPEIIVDGRALALGEEARVVIYREEARVEKVATLRERVQVERVERVRVEELAVDLRRERLDVQAIGGAVVKERDELAG